jgi:hypothetical protein
MYFKHIETDKEAARLKNEGLKKDAAARLAKNAAWNKLNKSK